MKMKVKPEIMRRYIKKYAIVPMCAPKDGCTLCNRIRAYRKALRETK